MATKKLFSITVLIIVFFSTTNAQKTWQQSYSHIYYNKEDGIHIVRYKNKFGYVDNNGKVAIPLDYSFAMPFKNGVAYVKKNYENGLIDSKGSFKKFAQQLRYATFLADGLIPALGTNGRFGAVNRLGNTVVEFKYDTVYTFNNGMAVVANKSWVSTKAGKSGTKQITVFKYGFVDTTGKEVMPIKYDEVSNFNNNIAIALLDKKYLVINKQGETLREFEGYLFFTNANILEHHYNSNGKNIVQLYNSKLEPIQKKAFEDVKYLRAKDNVIVAKSAGKWGILSLKGKKILDYSIDQIYPFSGASITVAAKAGNWGAINDAGKAITNFEYKSMSGFNEIDGTYYSIVTKMIGDQQMAGVIDAAGKIVVPITIPYADLQNSYTINKCLTYRKNGKYGVVDFAGNTYVPFEQDEIIEMKNNIFCLKKGNKWAIKSININTSTAYYYDNLTQSYDGFIIANVDQKYFLVDGYSTIWATKDIYPYISVSKLFGTPYIIVNTEYNGRSVTLGMDQFFGSQ